MIIVIILSVMLVLDIYTFKGLKILLTDGSHVRLKRILYIGFWLVSAFMMLLIISGYFFRSTTRNVNIFNWYYYFFGVFLVLYIPKIIFVAFHLTEDTVYVFAWFIRKLTATKPESSSNGRPISRFKFLSQTGILLATVPFFAFISGMVEGRFNFRVEHLTLSFPNLPKSFDGLKIVQISDLHIGSFKGFENRVADVIRMVNEQQPDIIFFTGDLVSNFDEELNGWIPILSEMKAKYGKYSILGNHDYGNYYHWNSETEKAENFKKIKEAEARIGFRLLNNQSEIFRLNGEEIAIIGVENWGHKPFPQYADFNKASKDVPDKLFKILLTHDPTHWDAKIVHKTDVDLTFSGHTHGMQFGIHLGDNEWSPAKYKYPHWAGLYREGKQYLYVNRGLGYIGYPGRVGMPPEITVIELKSSK